MVQECLVGLANEGRLTLQVPLVSFTGGTEIEVPEEWFTYLDSKNGKLVPSDASHGFTFFTEEGFEQNKDAIKSAFTTAILGKYNTTQEDIDQHWQSFLTYAQQHFSDLKHLGYATPR